MPRVTALVTAYNEQARIGAALDSLFAQSFDDFEVLVVDDGSEDDTPAILAALRDPRLRVIHAGRLGRGGALALGLQEARGDYVAILDADDAAYPERLARQAAFLDAHPDVAWLGCGEERCDTQRGEHAIRLYPQDDAAIRAMAARCIPYSHSGVMLRRAIVAEGLNYDPWQSCLIDFDLFLRVASRHRVANLPEPLVLRRLRDDSFFQSRFRRRAQNRALARMQADAVRRFALPARFHLFPLVRLGYDLVPDRAKRLLRRMAGLRERILPAA